MTDHHPRPQTEHLRVSGIGNRRFKESQLKKPQKIAKKSLNGAFASVSDDFPSETTKESSDFFEISDANQDHETAESFVFALNPVHSSSSGTSPLSDLTPKSKITTVDDELADFSANRLGVSQLDIPKIGLAELDIRTEKLLKQVRALSLNSPNAAYRHKKLLDGLLKVLMDEHSALPEGRGQFTELAYKKCRIVFLSLLLWSIVATLIFFFSSGPKRSYRGPFPT